VNGSDAWHPRDSGAWPPCSETEGPRPRAQLKHAGPRRFLMDRMH
jgi:hypothetical protein